MLIPMDRDKLIELIKRGLDKPGKTQGGLALALKRSDAVVSRMLAGARAIKAHEVDAIMAYLEEETAAGARKGRGAGRGRERTTPVFEFSNVASARNPLPGINTLPQDVPILGTAMGGDNGDFVFSGGTIDFARRTPAIAKNRGVYCLYVQGSSMAPWREEGQMIYVDPARPPRIGDYVVVQVKHPSAPEPTGAFVKRLVGKTATKLKLTQLNPARDFDIALERVAALHRVIGLEELLGV
jgi:phage repressor protein C with HTH and peptisase S24 domain